jgi:PAS domain S-box-containing protein
MSDPAEAADGAVGAAADDRAFSQRYRTLAGLVDAGVLQFDADGTVTGATDELLDSTGYERDDLLGQSVRTLVGEDGWDRIQRVLTGQSGPADDRASMELSVTTADGERQSCELRVGALTADGDPAGGVCTVRGVDDSTGSEPEREALQRELREREGRLSRLIGNVPGLVYRCRNERGWPMEFVSDACREITGYPPEAIERGVVEYGDDVIHEDDREAVWETIQSNATDREPFSVSYRIVTAEGETRWVEDRGRGVFEDGELVEIEGIISDVTERRRATRRLEEEREMFAAGPAVVFRWAPDAESGWPVEYVSPNVEDAFGYTPEQLTSGEVPFVDLLHDDDIDRVRATVETNSDDTTEWFTHDPYRVVTATGEVKWVTDTTRIVREDGEITNYLGYLVDVTERKRREHDLEQYRTIVQAMNDGVYVVDADGRFTRVNDQYVEMVGYDRDELLGEHVSVVVDEETIERAEAVEAAMRDGERETPTIEAELIRADGTRLPSEATFALFPGPEGEERRVGVARDVSDRKEYERKLERSNERLEEFAYAISHDLKEPLRMVSSYVQLIDERYGGTLDEDGEEFVEYAVDGAERMRDMIDGLLEYSRIESRGSAFEPVDLEAVVEDVSDDLWIKLEEHDATLTVADLPCVEGDASQLRQVFQNLLENAIEYSGDDPARIRVEAAGPRQDSDPAATCAAERTGAEWVVSVTDDGVGFDPELSGRVFEMFERLGRDDGGGTGIGLALCERIVDRHGGEIRVESTPGEGSTFRFTLPALEADSERE